MVPVVTENETIFSKNHAKSSIQSKKHRVFAKTQSRRALLILREKHFGIFENWFL